MPYCVIFMRLNIVKSKNAEQLYIIKSYRQKNGKNTSKIVAKLGNMDSLLPLHNNSRDEVILWAKQEAERLTDLEKEENDKILIELSQSSLIRPMFRLTIMAAIFFSRISSMISSLTGCALLSLRISVSDMILLLFCPD